MGSYWRKRFHSVLSFPIILAGLTLMVGLGVVVLGMAILLALLFLPVAVWLAISYRGGALMGIVAVAYYLALGVASCWFPAGFAWGPILFGGILFLVAPIMLLPTPWEFVSRPSHRKATYAALRFAALAGHHPHADSGRVVGTFSGGFVVRFRCGEHLLTSREYAVRPGDVNELDPKKVFGLAITVPPDVLPPAEED